MSVIPEGSVVISPADIYAEVRSLTTAVQALVATDKAEANDRAAMAARVEHLDTRLSAVERKLWMVTGAAASVGGLLGAWLPTVLNR